MRLLKRAVPFIAAAAAVVPGTASAGTYTVNSCAFPDGSPAGVSGWKVDAWASSIDHWGNTCPRGALWMEMENGVVHPTDDLMRMTFTAATDTTIVSYKLWRSVQIGAGTAYFFTGFDRRSTDEIWIDPSCKGTVNNCSGIGDPKAVRGDVNLFQRTPPLPLNQIGLYISCGEFGSGAPDCPASSPAAVAALHGAQIVIGDDFAPKFAADPGGGLVDPGTKSGTESVNVIATDRGGGVSNASVEIDGHTVTSSLLDDNDGHCRPPFDEPQPCKGNAGGTVSVDTSALSDGDHQLRVLVSDAAGNTTAWPASGALTIHTANRPPNADCDPNPTLTQDPPLLQSWFEQTVRVRAKHGKKRSRTATTQVRRTGLLTLALGKPSVLHAQLNNADGTPAANMPVCVSERLLGDDTGPVTPIARLNTGPDGSLAVPIPAGPSRELWVVRRVDGGALASTVNVQTRPQVSARARRHSLLNGQVLKLRGIVRGAPIPAPGVLVELQARRGRRWQTFKTKRTGVDGRWTAAYRFTRTAGVQRYQLRAHVPMQASYPYAAGASNTVTVSVRG